MEKSNRMNFTRQQLIRFYFSKDHTINIGCRFCNTGRLTADSNKVVDEETSSSKRHQVMPYANQDEYEGKFSILFRCNNAKCREIHLASGDVIFEEMRSYDEYSHEETFDGYDKQYYPRFFHPSIDIFTIDSNLPNNISEEIRKSFSLYFTDTNAAANRIRVAIEHLLSVLKIPTHNKAGNRHTLHNRITLLEKKQKNLSANLFAIKWIGNSGSHMENLSKPDIIDAYEIVEHIINELFIRKNKILHVRTIAKEINTKKGPRSK
ncbi:DUF4145 domain-containing protein [Hymenobacter metallicola]|uniref:DUF4145 domain-containing protein n=1 Tax=Hymenobacter metallicola TaxID=2563114 RepID=A0A4Z0Q0L3_9BACT|nr:DUF4145 domain-containing protein [Hymenobacter metallicola]TGE23570.1 DUF4145 domain-containing protein [Hymenobacter metallicola]